MTDKSLKKMNRTALLKLLLDVQKENDALRTENESLKEALESKELKMRSVGSIAEAALLLNGVFEAAQAAADQYLQNVRTQYSQEATAEQTENDGGDV